MVMKKKFLFYLTVTVLYLRGGDFVNGRKRDEVEFSKYTEIHPSYSKGHSRSKRSSSSSEFSVSFRGPHGREVVLDLIPDSGFAENAFQKYQKNNSYVYEKPSSEACYYNGKVRGQENSMVAVSDCDNSLTGIIYDGKTFFHLQNNRLYDDRDRLAEKRCGFPDSPTAHRPRRHISKTSKVFNGTYFKKMPSAPAVRKPWNANKNSRYVELLLVVDNKEFKEHGRDLPKVHRMCKDIANVMNALYSPLNIYIALVGVIVWTEYDEITLDTKGDETLTNFLHYRRQRLVKDHPNDNAQLLTGIEFEGGVVGKALKGPICTFEFSGGVNMWHSNIISLVATTIAHELGHNFGMEHDDSDCTCPDDRCIMAPASSTMKPSFWSSCSLDHLALAFEQGMDYCLRNKPEKLFEGPVCGNGFVEEGEECDCGLKHHCDNGCCDPDTCTLTKGALCATGECCDFKTCKPKVAGNLCRIEEKECDLPEYCTGDSEFCPNDVYKVDGTMCKKGKAFCYKGSCRTHSDQCKLLWGPSGKKSNNQCYELNTKGNRKGNCGYHRVNESYVKCRKIDVRCGMLHCSHYNEKLEFGMEKVSILSHSFINSGGEIIPCRTALVDLGINDVDPGLAPEGSRCDTSGICVNRECIPVGSLRIGPHSCECSDHGVCNSQGNCHCNEGFEPPFCIQPGRGGSIDSGPAGLLIEDVADHTNLIAILSSLALIPLICLCLYCFVCARRIKKEREDGRTPLPSRTLPDFMREPCGLFKKSTVTESENGTAMVDIDRYEKKSAISGPVLVSATSESVSSESSPTHALLPNGGAKKNKNNNHEEESSVPSDPPPESSQSDEVAYSRNSEKKSFFSNFNKSLKSFNSERNFKRYFSPSNFRTSKSGGDLPKYQIKVEKREETNNEDSILSPTTEEVDAIIVRNEEASIPVADDETPPPSYYESCATSLGFNKFKKSKTLPPIHVNYENNPKLAFPHSSSYDAVLGGLKLPKDTTSLTDKKVLSKKEGEPVISKPESPKDNSLIVASRRPLISKPVLQKATPSAASLISKAPSTGVSQSSILTTKEAPTKDREKRSSRGVVFCDPLTLPSPTNPNTPPIIHQPIVGVSVATPPATVMSRWSKTESPKRISDENILHIDAEEDKTKTSVAPIASPENDKISNKIQIFRGSAPPPPPPRASEMGGTRRSIPISNPVLKSPVDLKSNLTPVARENTSVINLSRPSSSPLPAKNGSVKISKKKKDFQPPSLPTRSSKPTIIKIEKTADGGYSSKQLSPQSSSKFSKNRPASIATSKPGRPSAPPPPRPPFDRKTIQEPYSSNEHRNSEPDFSLFKSDPSPDTISTGSSNDGELLKEILMEADKRVEAETGESEVYSTLMRKNKKAKKNNS